MYPTGTGAVLNRSLRDLCTVWSIHGGEHAMRAWVLGKLGYMSYMDENHR